MEQLKNFLPLIVFVAVYVTTDIFYATAALMIAVTLQVALYLLMKKKLPMELKVTFWVGLVMGSLTLIFRDEQFIQWKTTIVNWAMATVLIGTHFFGKAYGTQTVLKAMLKDALRDEPTGPQQEQPAQKTIWRNINLIWIASFTIAGALNLFVAYNFSLDVWVSYKLIGGFVLTFTTIVITMFYLYKSGLVADVDSDPDSAGDSGSARKRETADNTL